MATRSPAHVALGRAVRELRERQGVSQEELANRSRLHRTYVGGIERGERNPSFTSLLRLAKVLDVETSELVAHSEQLLEHRS